MGWVWIMEVAQVIGEGRLAGNPDLLASERRSNFACAMQEAV